MALEHLVLTDDGTRDLPGEDSAWLEWVSASKGRNFVLGEPLLDWLDLYGSDKGFVPDNELPGYDERFDFGSRIMNQGNAFEAAALRWLEERFDMVSVSTGWRDTRDRAAAERTFQAMMEGREIISQAVLWNPQTYRDMKVGTRGSFGGLGIEITIKGSVLTVVAPIGGTPAAKAGIKAGDRIVRIGSESTTSKFTVNFCATFFSMLQFFQDENT